jgi:hypothetical protein
MNPLGVLTAADACGSESYSKKYGAQLGDALGRHGIVGELATSNRVAQWAYAQTEAARGLTWLRADEMVPLAAAWRELLP